jgi:hypothetical protein
MRNYSSLVGYDSVFTADANMSFTDPSFVRIQEALVITMGANPSMLTTSEERVLADFIGWLLHCKEESVNTPPRAPVFVYHNLNEGHSLAVIWTDLKGKVSYLQQ